jgi:hypothetical protein
VGEARQPATAPTTVGPVSRRPPPAPFVPRVVVIASLLGATLIGATALAGCSEHHEATGFCATIRRGHSAFNSTDAAHAKRALAEFDRVAASAPATVAPDLKTIAAVIRKPTQLVDNPALIKRYFAAIGRVDRYLHQSCGLTVPPPGKLF